MNIRKPALHRVQKFKPFSLIIDTGEIVTEIKENISSCLSLSQRHHLPLTSSVGNLNDSSHFCEEPQSEECCWLWYVKTRLTEVTVGIIIISVGGWSATSLSWVGQRIPAALPKQISRNDHRTSISSSSHLSPGRWRSVALSETHQSTGDGPIQTYHYVNIPFVGLIRKSVSRAMVTPSRPWRHPNPQESFAAPQAASRGTPSHSNSAAWARPFSTTLALL